MLLGIQFFERWLPANLAASLLRKSLSIVDVFRLAQGCQMVCFQTKGPNLGKFWRVLQWKILVYILTIWSILRPSEVFYGHLVYFVVIWYISPRFGMLYHEKTGNPGLACLVCTPGAFRFRLMFRCMFQC
jgi:hypothetical protein